MNNSPLNMICRDLLELRASQICRYTCYTQLKNRSEQATSPLLFLSSMISKLYQSFGEQQSGTKWAFQWLYWIQVGLTLKTLYSRFFSIYEFLLIWMKYILQPLSIQTLFFSQPPSWSKSGAFIWETKAEKIGGTREEIFG